MLVLLRWQKDGSIFFRKLLNEKSDHQSKVSAPVCSPVEKITKEEVKIAISRMKDKRIASEMYKGMGKLGFDEVTKALRKIAIEGRTPTSWKESTTNALHKRKGDALDYSKRRD